MYILHYSPPRGGWHKNGKKSRCGTRMRSEAVGRGVFKTSSCGKKMYDLGRWLRSFKSQMWHKCGSYKAKWWVFMLWIIIVIHICFYFYSHATNEHEKCFFIIKIWHENNDTIFLFLILVPHLRVKKIYHSTKYVAEKFFFF